MKNTLLRNRRIVWASAAAAGLVALALTSGPAPTASVAKAPNERPVAPDWELKDVDGKTVSSSDFKGKVVVLDFWATWCPPCRAEIPHFVELQKQYGDKGLAIVGVSLDRQGAEVVKPFMKKTGINYSVVLSDSKLEDRFGGVSAIPTTFVIDRAGRIVSKHVGFAEKAVFEAEIVPLLD